MRARYRRWDGTQDPITGDLDLGEVLDEISEDVLSGLGAEMALRRLMRRGLAGRMAGLDELRARLNSRRRRLARELDLEGPLERLKQRLKEILAEERRLLADDPGEGARARETFLDALPDGPAGAIKELMGYRFRSRGAQEGFDRLVEEIRQQVLAAHFRNLTGALRTTTPQELARLREMLEALNAMISARERGQAYDFEGFMARYGDFFPERPRTLDELLQVLARRMAALSRLLAGLSPEQRRELQELLGAVLQDLDVAFEMEQLSDELRRLVPHLPWDEPAMGSGEDAVPLEAAVDAIELMSELEELEQAAGGRYPGARIDDIDEERLRRALGHEAVRDLRRLKEIEKALENAGLLTKARGRLELSARGARRLGERALVKVFEGIRPERPGAHESPESGGAAEPTGATRPWHFGDTGEISVQRTVFNAVLRGAGRPPRPLHPSGGARGIALRPEDFEVVEAETRTRAATALALDLSFSMPLRGHWIPAKRMALALHALIQGKYPQDHLYLIGFSDYARRLKPVDLTSSAPVERVYGTNMQHAFLLARRLLCEHPRVARQVIMVTDGEPTAHLVEDGPGSGPRAIFSWPPTPETIRATLAEAIRLTSAGITLNIFMLEDAPGLVAFTERLAKAVGGRVFHAADGELERLVLRDYVRRR